MKKATIVFLLIVFCCKTIKRNLDNEPLYFFFNAQHMDMQKYISDFEDETKFFYVLSKRNAIFTSYKPKQEIFAKDTVNIKMKKLDWLQKLTITQFDSLFYKKLKSDKIFIIEKDLTNNKLYKYDVLRTLEIE